MRKFFRVTVRIAGALLVFLLLCIVAIPVLFKDEITEVVRKAVDRQIEGAFYFEKAEVGILRTFPHLCLKLTKPVLTGGTHPQGDSLFSAQSVDIVVNVRSLLKKSEALEINGIVLTAPRISLYTGRDGTTNYQLVTPRDTSDTDTSDTLAFDIEHYTVTDGYLKYIDAGDVLLFVAQKLDHKGKLTYRGNTIDLQTTTESGTLTLDYGGLNYFKNIQVQGSNDLRIDLDKSLYTLLDNQMQINALNVDISGSIMFGESASEYDLTFHGDRNTFKNFLSLMPNMYTSEFQSVDAQGNLELSGTLKGSLSESTVPVYNIVLRVNQGMFKYPGKPLGVERISVDGTLHNDTRTWSPAEIDLRTLRFTLNNQPFDAKLRITNPTAIANYEGILKGSVNLADLSNAYPLPGFNELSGQITADVRFSIDGRKPMTEQLVAGDMLLENMRIVSGDNTLSAGKATMTFSPTHIALQSTDASWNESPLTAMLHAKQYIPWLTTDGQMLIDGNVSLGRLDVNTYMNEGAGADTTFVYDSRFNKVFLDGRLNVGTLIYDTYVIEDGRTQVIGTLQDLEITSASGRINGTTFSGSGTVSNIDRYLADEAPLTGKLDVRVDKVYLDRWIEDDKATDTAEEASYVALPSNLDLDIEFRGDVLHYDRLEIRNPRGRIRMIGQTLEIHDFKGSGMGGEMALSGLYSTEDILKPAFNIKYDLTRLRFSETFRQIETFRELAPIVQFIQGVFNSSLVMEGRLGKNYIPDLSTLTASGFLETLEGTLRQAEILDKVSQFLNLKAPIRWNLSESRNWFEVNDGYLTLQEFTRTVDDIEIALGGRYQIQGESDFLFKFNIPADRVASNPVGALAKAGYEQMQSKAASYGVRLNTIERFVVHVAMRGRMSDPAFEIKLFDATGKSLKEVAADEIQALKEQVRDTITTLVEEKRDALRDTVKSTAEHAADSLRRIAEEKLREATKEVISQATERLDSLVRDSLRRQLIDKAGDKAKDILGEQSAKEADKIKETLEKWDPFKKRKD